MLRILPIEVKRKRGVSLATWLKVMSSYSILQVLRCFPQPDGYFDIRFAMTHHTEVLQRLKINPRISTTMVITIAAGIDPFESLKGRILSSCQSAQNSSSPPLGQRYRLKK